MLYKIGGGLVITAALALLLFTFSQSQDQDNITKYLSTNPEAVIYDAHGLDVDNSDSSKLIIPSHSGLYGLKAAKDLSLIGSGTDDYMGFSAHPTDSRIYYTSGHSATTGNLGVQKSIDAGKTWKKIADGLGGPVDFHTMAIDQVDPQIIYGVSQGRLQRSIDEGGNWAYVDGAPQGITQLAAGAKQNTLYAATTSGLQVSTDQAETWAPLLDSGAIMAVAVNPASDQELLSFGQELGLAKSIDGGINWSKVTSPFVTDKIRFLAYDSKDTATVYALTQSLAIYQTKDTGNTWIKIR